MTRYFIIFILTFFSSLIALGQECTIPVIHYTPFSFESIVKNTLEKEKCSSFWLALYPYDVSQHKYSGHLEEDKIIYSDSIGNRYTSLEALITNSEKISLDEFVDIYAGCYKQQMLRSTHSNLHSMNIEEAKEVIRSSYFCNWIKHKDKTKSIEEFCALIHSWIPELDSQAVQETLTFLLSSNQDIDRYIFANLSTARDYIPLCGTNIYSHLQSTLEASVFEHLLNHFMLYQTKIRYAIEFIREHRSEDVGVANLFNTYGFVSDYELVEYLSLQTVEESLSM